MTTTSPSAAPIVLTGLRFAWPDGTPVLGPLDATIGPGRTGLVGDNGAGKSTLLRLIAGTLAPTAGHVRTSGAVGHLPQQVALRTAATVADLLGLRARLDALRAIEAGSLDPRHHDVLADDWGVEARGAAALEAAGLDGIGLDRRVDQLSGGEAVLVALTGVRLAATPIVLLDEPTNDLDRPARHRLHDALATWPGTIVVASHDTALLDRMDRTAELRGGALALFGGPLHAQRRHVATEQAAARQGLRTARQALALERHQQVEAQVKLARRARYARTDFENKRRPKTIMKQRRSEAQVSAARLRDEADGKVAAAREAVAVAAERVRADARVVVDLPDPGLAAGRTVAELHDGRGRTHSIRGPERVALVGRNGVGKTRLLRTLVEPGSGADPTAPHGVARTDRIGYLPQRLDHVDDGASALAAVHAAAPDRPVGEVRALLARLRLRAEAVHRPVGDLSGGERLRVALARLLVADPPHHLLVLDEPTNDVDLATVDALVDALAGSGGALLVVSHDDDLLGRLAVTTWLHLTAEGFDETSTTGP